MRPEFKRVDSTVGLTSLFRCHFIIAVNRVATRGGATITQQANLQDIKGSVYEHAHKEVN